jgi:hypothetical protein
LKTCRSATRASGEAEVRNVFRVEKPDSSSIFIRVNKNLDPDKDGFPNPVFLKSRIIIASRFFKENAWRNGVSFEKPGLFFFSIKENELVTVKVGDRLKFMKSGEAIVGNVVKDKVQNQKFNIMDSVDKLLDPDKDGFPNPIDVLLNI